jgi:phage terminase small subunit
MPLLTDRQERFIEEYLIDQNASAAAARAGYTARNMAAQGSELMNHPEIRERIRAAMQDVLAEIRASALDLMKRRVAAVYFDPIRLFKAGWEPMPVEEMDAETRALVEVRTVMRKSGRVVYVKQPDRDKALRALERFHEKLERLQEKEAERLWKAGLCLSLEEIEALDGGGAEGEGISDKPHVLSGGGVEEGGNFSQKGMVLSGSGDGLDPRLRGDAPKEVPLGHDKQWGVGVSRENCEDDQVLSGWSVGANGASSTPDPEIRGQSPTSLGHDQQQGPGASRENGENDQVLSGKRSEDGLDSRLRGNAPKEVPLGHDSGGRRGREVMGGWEKAEETMVLSGGAAGAGALVRGNPEKPKEMSGREAALA